MACNNPPCCSCGPWQSMSYSSAGGIYATSIQYMLLHTIGAADQIPFDIAEVDFEESYPYDNGLRKYRVTPDYDFSIMHLIPPIHLFGWWHCGLGQSANANHFRFFWSTGCEGYNNDDYGYHVGSIKSFWCGYIHADHWWFVIWTLVNPTIEWVPGTGVGFHFYDLGTTTPPDDLEDLDLSAITPWVRPGGVPVFENVVFEKLTEAEWSNYENNHSSQWEIYTFNTDTLFDYDQTSAADPPWGCFVEGIYHIDGYEDVPVCMYAYGNRAWPTFVLKMIGDTYIPLSSATWLTFSKDVDDVVVSSTIWSDGTPYVGSQVNLGAWPLTDLPFPFQVTMNAFNVNNYIRIDRWATECYGETGIDCGGAIVPSCLVIETAATVCGDISFPARVYLPRVGDTCQFASGSVSYSDGTFSILATIDESGMLELTSDTFFGEHYSFRLQLVDEKIYENTSDTILNGVAEEEGDTRYLKSIVVKWRTEEECATGDPDDCPLCDGGSTEVKCIRGQVMNGELLIFFMMTRSAQCTWTGVYVDCESEDPVEYTVVLTATAEDCMATFEAVITKAESSDYVKYRRRYNVNNVKTNCHGTYLLPEYERSGMSELGDGFHMSHGLDDECEEEIYGTYNWPESIAVLKTDDDREYLINLFSYTETEAVYKDINFQVQCVSNTNYYLFSEWKVTLTRVGDYCLKVKAEFTPDEAMPGACNFGTTGSLLTMIEMFHIENYLCHPADYPLAQYIWEIRADYDSIECH